MTSDKLTRAELVQGQVDPLPISRAQHVDKNVTFLKCNKILFKFVYLFILLDTRTYHSKFKNK
jgi:hypothetical protein